MARVDPISVEIVYALPERQTLRRVRVPAGTSAIEAVRRSGIAAAHPDLDLASARLGIYARRIGHDAILRDGDRVEIYRPLQADPKSVRRARAEASRRRI